MFVRTLVIHQLYTTRVRCVYAARRWAAARFLKPEDETQALLDLAHKPCRNLADGIVKIHLV